MLFGDTKYPSWHRWHFSKSHSAHKESYFWQTSAQLRQLHECESGRIGSMKHTQRTVLPVSVDVTGASPSFGIALSCPIAIPWAKFYEIMKWLLFLRKFDNTHFAAGSVVRNYLCSMYPCTCCNHPPNIPCSRNMYQSDDRSSRFARQCSSSGHRCLEAYQDKLLQTLLLVGLRCDSNHTVSRLTSWFHPSKDVRLAHLKLVAFINSGLFGVGGQAAGASESLSTWLKVWWVINITLNSWIINAERARKSAERQNNTDCMSESTRLLPLRAARLPQTVRFTAAFHVKKYGADLAPMYRRDSACICDQTNLVEGGGGSSWAQKLSKIHPSIADDTAIQKYNRRHRIRKQQQAPLYAGCSISADIWADS